MNPRDLRSWDLMNIEGLSQDEITQRLKTDDKLKMREVARVEDIQNPIAPPGNINLVTVSEENERRVALPEDQLKRLVINMFTTDKDAKEAWKVEEMTQRLDQPRQPVKKAMDLLCNRDKIRNVYTLKSTVLTHSWKK